MVISLYHVMVILGTKTTTLLVSASHFDLPQSISHPRHFPGSNQNTLFFSDFFVSYFSRCMKPSTHNRDHVSVLQKVKEVHHFLIRVNSLVTNVPQKEPAIIFLD
jgi:hypothetical protein